MQVLIVEENSGLVDIWSRALERLGANVSVAADEDSAIASLSERCFDVVVENLMPTRGSSFAVADFAGYRCPDAKVVFVTSSTFFSDGSIFQLVSNACAIVPRDTRPEDLAAVVEHHAADKRPRE